MRTMLLTALCVSVCCFGTVAHAQEPAHPLTDSAQFELMAKAIVPGRLAATVGPLGILSPTYTSVRRAEAWRTPESGQEIRVDELSMQAYLRKHPRVTFRITGTFAQHDHDAATSVRAFSTYGLPVEHERKLSLGVAYQH